MKATSLKELANKTVDQRIADRLAKSAGQPTTKVCDCGQQMQRNGKAWHCPKCKTGYVQV